MMSSSTPPLQRHRLAVIAGAPARTVIGTRCRAQARRDADDVGLVARRDDQIGGFAVELLVQDRAVPEEIARAPAHDLGFGDDGNVAEIGDK